MKGWHLEHAERVIASFPAGLSPDASDFERRNYYTKYGTVAGCIRQVEYDMRHGVQKREVREKLSAR